MPNAIKKMPQSNGLMLPGNVNVPYTCETGYELENPEINAAKCDYAFEDRAGRPENNNDQLVTAIWAGHERIRCKKG